VLSDECGVHPLSRLEDRRCADPVHRMTNPDETWNGMLAFLHAGCPGTWRMRNSGGARAAHADWHRERNATGQIGIRSLCFSETKNTNELKKRRRLSSTGIYPPAHDPPPPPDMACVIHTHHSCVESIQHVPLLLHQNSASAKFLDNQHAEKPSFRSTSGFVIRCTGSAHES
jgi:hypothetical protein